MSFYEKHWTFFKDFCLSNNHSYLPASSRTVELFMLYHVHVRAFSTLPSILAAISHFHCRHNLSTPTTSCAVTHTLQGANRLLALHQLLARKKILDDRFNLTLRRDTSFILIRTV